jgi:hypothetical protein
MSFESLKATEAYTPLREHICKDRKKKLSTTYERLDVAKRRTRWSRSVQLSTSPYGGQNLPTRVSFLNAKAFKNSSRDSKYRTLTNVLLLTEWQVLWHLSSCFFTN